MPAKRNFGSTQQRSEYTGTITVTLVGANMQMAKIKIGLLPS